MPIRPENRDRYPDNWKSEIRPRILERAKHKCEQCRAPDRTVIARGEGNDADTYMLEHGEVFHADTGDYIGLCRGSEFDGRPVVVILTVSHLDHAPENCDDSNLRALCQRCHNRHDAPHRAITRQRTARARLAIGDLFDVTQKGTPA